MDKPLWQPTAATIHNSNMYRFIEFVNTNYSLTFTNYTELYEWSINFPKDFWPAVWRFCNIKSSEHWQNIVINFDQMPGAKWFTGAKLNFAENLLQYSGDKVAILSYNEKGEHRAILYSELKLEVAKLANSLRKAGVCAGNRIAGLLPNIPATVIAMLATTSIGAIWSSCSPDFGVHGVYDRFHQIAPKILFVTDGYFYNGKTYDNSEKINTLLQQIPAIEQVILISYVSQSNNYSGKVINYYDFIANADSKLQFSQLPFDHPVYILYSSGTTGVPKCIVHSAGGTLIQHLKELVLHTDLKPEDVIFYYTTCGWMMWNWLVSSLAIGATIVLYDGSPFHPKPAALFNMIDQLKITIFGTSAKFISAVEKYQLEPIKTHQLTSLRTILSTGSPLLPMNFDFVYQKIKPTICLSSISGGTDIVSCFALGNPMLPVYSGELQCRGLGLSVQVFDEHGQSIQQQKGELVCTSPFPAMPIYFWNDEDSKKYQQAYFAQFPNVWAHGDFAELTKHDGLIIYGRSDAVLNPGGVRIGTAEIYRQVEKIEDIVESLVVGQEWSNDIRLVLFIKLKDNQTLSPELIQKIKQTIRTNASHHHVPAKIIQVPDIPRTINGKIVELAVREIIHGRTIKNIDAIANPEALAYFKNIEDLKH